MKAWAWALIGLGAAAVVVTGAGVAEHYAHAGPKCNVPSELQSGHRYKITIVDPSNTQPIPNTAAVQTLLSQAFPNTVNIVAVDPLGTTSVTIVLDVTGKSVSEPAGFCQQLASKGASITIVDMGASPGGG